MATAKKKTVKKPAAKKEPELLVMDQLLKSREKCIKNQEETIEELIRERERTEYRMREMSLKVALKDKLLHCCGNCSQYHNTPKQHEQYECLGFEENGLTRSFFYPKPWECCDKWVQRGGGS